VKPCADEHSVRDRPQADGLHVTFGTQFSALRALQRSGSDLPRNAEASSSVMIKTGMSCQDGDAARYVAGLLLRVRSADSKHSGITRDARFDCDSDIHLCIQCRYILRVRLNARLPKPQTSKGMQVTVQE